MSFFTDTYTGIALLILGQCLLVTVLVLVSLAFLMYGDRKIWAAVQMRKGPNVVGAFGLLQSFADFGKYIVKEIVVPAGADRPVFFLAPMVAFCLPMIVWVAIPFNEGWVISDLNVAILYIFAISSLEVYGIIMGGWASNSKYPFLGSLRSAAQMISYEVSIGLIIIGVVISTGSLNLTEIVKAQDGAGGLLNWYVLPHLPMFFLFFISALAETNRPPFDLPEAESELVAGYQVEYSSTPFLLFMIGELMAVWMMCAIISLLFLGGWLSPLPFLPDGFLWMLLKMIFCFFIFSMVKAITPRYRYDQLMRIGWKVFLPLSLAWVVIVAFLAKFEVAGSFWARWEREPATLTEFIGRSCTDEFNMVAASAPGLFTALENNPPNEASTFDEATRAVTMAHVMGLFVQNIDVDGEGMALLKPGTSDEARDELRVSTDLSACLLAEHGSVVQGTDVNDQGDMGFGDIQAFINTALASEDM